MNKQDVKLGETYRLSAHVIEDRVGRANGDLIGKEIWDAGHVHAHWTNLQGQASDPWDKRKTPESKFVYDPAPRWTEVVMVTHKKNRQVVIRTNAGSYLDVANLVFLPGDIIKYRDKRR